MNQQDSWLWKLANLIGQQISCKSFGHSEADALNFVLSGRKVIDLMRIFQLVGQD